VSEPSLNSAWAERPIPLGELPLTDPPADLWQRIAATHARRQRRRRGLLFAGAAAAVVCLVGAWHFASPPAAEIDWQARAQALEMQLHALADAQRNGAAAATEGELGRVDDALQTAFDAGADPRDVNALWKRRSELLDALLKARVRAAEINRI
jgi:hypothetical protein